MEESRSNNGEVSVRDCGDPYISLSDKGIGQARQLGADLGADLIGESLIYCSPYLRTRETLKYMLEGCHLRAEEMKIYEDPRLREIEFGYGEPEDLSVRARHGWFYYRHHQGESPADCYDRVCTFLESMMRQVNRRVKVENIVIVTHGMVIRCFLAQLSSSGSGRI